MRKWLMPLLHDSIKASGGKLRILASPWSPPTWMKTNKHYAMAMPTAGGSYAHPGAHKVV